MSYGNLILRSGNCVGYWRLGELAGTTAFDRSGAGQNGTYSGGYTLGQAGAIADGTFAASFDGITGSVGKSGYDPFSGATGVTLEAWVKGDGAWSAGLEGVVNFGGSGCYLAVDNGFIKGSLVLGGTQRTLVGSGSVPQDGRFHHLVLTWAASNPMRLYLDGVLVGSSVSFLGPHSSAPDLLIGAALPGPSLLAGTIDEVAIYTRALTASEVAEHYQTRLDVRQFLQLTVANVDRTANWHYQGDIVADGIRFARRTGSSSPATVKLYDTIGAGGYRPDTGQFVGFFEDGSPVHAGFITDVDEGGLSDLDTGVLTTVMFTDYASCAARAPYTVTFPAGTHTLKQVLLNLVATPLAPFGITLNPFQVDGPTFATELVFVDIKVIDILNQLQTLTGYVWTITAAGVLAMSPAGTVSSGLAFGDATGNVMAPVKLRKTRSTSYANRVALQCGPAGIPAAPRSEAVTADGVASSWTFDVADGTPYTSAGGGGTINVGGVIKNSAAGDFTWTLDPSTATATLTLPAPPAFGTGIAFDRDINYPFKVIAQDSGLVAVEGPFPATYEDESILDVSTGVASVAALLARDSAEPWVVTVVARLSGAVVPFPGQTVDLDFAEREVAGTYMVLTVESGTDSEGKQIVTLECLEGTELQTDWLDYFKAIGRR